MDLKWCWVSFIVDPTIILIFGLLGLKLKDKFPKRMKEYMLFAIALTASAVGLASFPKVFDVGNGKSMIILAFLTIVIGAALGSWFHVDIRLQRYINKKWGNEKQKGEATKYSLEEYEEKCSKEGDIKTPGWAFATATYISLVGVLAITGPIHEATDGIIVFILIKCVLDAVATFVFVMDWGKSVIWSFIPVFFVQLVIGLFAAALKGFFSAVVLNFSDGVGGVLIFAMGLSVAGVLKGRGGKDFHTGNFVPAMLLAPFVANLALLLNFFM